MTQQQPPTNIQWVQLSDFSGGIFTDRFALLPDDTDPTPTQEGSLQEAGTYGCRAGPYGGLMPLPRARAYLRNDDVPFSGDRIPIIAAKVVAPVGGVTTPDLHQTTLEDNPILYYNAEDTVGSEIVVDQTHHEYELLTGIAAPEPIMGDGTVAVGGFPVISSVEGTDLLTEPWTDDPRADFVNGVPKVLQSGYTWTSTDSTSVDVWATFGLLSFDLISGANMSAEEWTVQTTLPFTGESAWVAETFMYYQPALRDSSTRFHFYITQGALGGGGSKWVELVIFPDLMGGDTDWTYQLVHRPSGSGNQVATGTLTLNNGSKVTLVHLADGTTSIYIDDVFVDISSSTAMTITPDRVYCGLAITPNFIILDYFAGDLAYGQVTFTQGSHSPLVLFPPGEYHGDFGDLAGGPITEIVPFDDFTSGFAIVDQGVCGNAIALGDAYLRTGVFTTLYQPHFTIEARIKLIDPIIGGVILLKDMAAGMPLVALNLSLSLCSITIYNTDGDAWARASFIPGDIALDVTEWHQYVARFDGERLDLFVDAVSQAFDNGFPGTGVGTRATAANSRLEIYGNVAAFDEVTYYDHPLSLFRIAVHFHSQCNGASTFRSLIAVEYQWYEVDAESGDAAGHTLVRLYRPGTALNDTGPVLMPSSTWYDPFTDAQDFADINIDDFVIRYGYADFDLTRSNPDDPEGQVGTSTLVYVASPIYRDDSADHTISVTPDPTNAGTDSTVEISDGFIYGTVAHQGRVLWMGGFSPVPAEAFGSGQFIDIYERWAWTAFNDTTTVENPLSTIYVEEAPFGYGSWVSINAQELFLVKRFGGAVVVRGDVNNPSSVVRLPGVASTGRFANRGIHTPFGYVYGSEQGAWLWAGGDNATLLSPQLHGDFLDATGRPDAYVGLRGTFTYRDPYVFCPNSWVFDTRTESWWRLRNHPDVENVCGDSTQYPSIWYDVDLDGNVYAFPQFFNNTFPVRIAGPYFDGYFAAFCQIYDTKLGETKMQATTQPFSRSRQRELRFREVVLRCQGRGTITITLVGIDGTESDPAVFTVDSDIEVTFRDYLALAGHDVSARILSEGATPETEAPTVWEVDFGYHEAQRVSAGG